MDDTIFALSSGSPPAAIGVLRISGTRAGHALCELAGALPAPRRATVRTLRDGQGQELDRALILWFPGPASATGEDLAEIHCHGGRAVVAAIERALEAMPQLRRAQPGEYVRRAFANGRIDLSEAEGLADLLAAETELQRQAAAASAGGALSRQVETWRMHLLGFAAQVEAALDFGDEDDGIGEVTEECREGIGELARELEAWLARPRVERLRDGVRVVLAGPPNAGKSSLFNAILEEGAAIVSAEAGTTRDAIERPIALDGTPFVLIDTAGLRTSGAGEVESIGIDRARNEIDRADLILWLGPEGEGPAGAIEIAAKCDLGRPTKPGAAHMVSSVTGAGIDALVEDLVARAGKLLPKPGVPALNQRQRFAIREALKALDAGRDQRDALLLAESLRAARVAFDRLLGRNSTEEMLDALFGRFCIGK